MEVHIEAIAQGFKKVNDNFAELVIDRELPFPLLVNRQTFEKNALRFKESINNKETLMMKCDLKKSKKGTWFFMIWSYVEGIPTELSEEEINEFAKEVFNESV